MISTTSDYTLTNPSVTTYKYTLNFLTYSSAPMTFSPTTYVTNTMRAFYGYTSSSLIKAVEFNIIGCECECPIASAMNVQAYTSCKSVGADYQVMGSVVGWASGPLHRTIGAVTSSQSLLIPASTLYMVKTPANYATTVFIFDIYSLTTNLPIASSDMIVWTIEQTEYVSKY